MQAEAPTRKEKTVEEVTTLGKKVAEGEEYFAVAHIFASFNDTFVVSHITKSSFSFSYTTNLESLHLICRSMVELFSVIIGFYPLSESKHYHHTNGYIISDAVIIAHHRSFRP